MSKEDPLVKELLLRAEKKSPLKQPRQESIGEWLKKPPHHDSAEQMMKVRNPELFERKK